MSDEQELVLAATIAQAYYLEDQSMVAIAGQLGLTRFQVARLLDLARKSGIVRIEIVPPNVVDTELSARVAATLGVGRAIVIQGSFTNPRSQIGKAVAELLPTIVHAGEVVGLTWSRTTVEVVAQLKDLPPAVLVQLAGHATSESSAPGSVEIIRRAAEISGGVPYPIYAPMLAPDSYVAHALLQEGDIGRAVELYNRLNVAVVSIGVWAEGKSSVYDALTPREQAMGTAAGAVGEMSGRLFSAEGEPVKQVIDDRVIGISLEQLARTPLVVGTAYGADHADAVRAAARAVPFGILVVDQSLAQALVDGQGDSPTAPAD